MTDEDSAEFAGDPDAFGRLWTPHRMVYIKGENKPDHIEPGDECPFCFAPTRSDEDGLIVARGELVYAVLNLYPYNSGHLMTVPYRHVADYTDLTRAETDELGALTQQAMRTLRIVMGPHGFNIGLNQGTVAGAGIAGHLHQHVVPRWGGDTNFMPVVAQTRVLPQLLSDARELVAAAWGEWVLMGGGVLHVRGVFLPDETERDAWVLDGRLTFTRPAAEADTVAAGGWIVPGLVDAHCHVGFAPQGHVPDAEGQAAQALLDRGAGALLLRDAGSPVDNTSVQARDDLPRLIRAGRHIARTKRYIRDLGIEVEPDELVAEVERQVAAGDGWVKLAADWIDRDLGDLAPTWPDDALKAGIGRAHELGARVAAHVFGEDALPGLIAAGIDSIEHGTGLTDDLIAAAAASGAALVPTLINIDNFPSIAVSGAAKYPTYAAHMRALYATSRDRVRTAFEAGVPIYTGTDAGGSLPHGLVRDEIRALVGAGIPQAEVIAQASWRGREWLGLPGLVEGAPADFVVYGEDPRVDLATIYAARRTVLRGAVVS